MWGVRGFCPSHAMAYKSHRVHQQCTLPSILDTYLSPDLKNKHHLEVYWGMYRLRDELAHRYAALLREKVQRQRLEIRQREEHLIQTQRSQIKKKKKKSPEGQKLSRLTVSHNEVHFRDFPKTTYYLILEVQSLLVQHGYLKTHQERELFNQWVDQHRKGSKLREKLNQMVICSKSAPNLGFESLMKRQFLLPKIHISSHDRDPQEDTAVGRQGMLGESGGSTPDPGGKQAQEWDGAKQMFPKMVSQPVRRPKFATLQPSFMDALRNTILPTAPKLPEKRSIDSNLLKLRLMHNLSLTHMAFSQRLLGKGGPILEDGYQMRHLSDYMFPHSNDFMEADQTTRKTLLSSLSQSLSNRTTSDVDGDTEPTPALCPHTETKSETQDRKPCEGGIASVHPEEPLSINDLLQQNTSPVDDCSVKMWQNYSMLKCCIK
ncbi:uncharacterized protein si:ch211-130h14.4 isoform X2 [Alosa alosa]|uniref:uncharacterized protein si:ch211-130h14.4 isoform X2 n=1 Tax=Alosa alosa TaxID=278164 RepID=UPI0020150B96|nr:uncharacterized protein si:ch211-130h14.4 isoform X2 [Alosa alosa]